MRMKKFLSIFMSLVMLVSITAGLDMSAYAATYSGTCGADGDNVTWELDTETGTLTISGEGDMYDYYSTADIPWASYRSYIKKVVINSGVTSIDEYAFYYFESLTSITVNENNQYYSSQDGALFNKDKTELIQYPIGKTRTSYTIPNGVASIGEHAFSYCTSLEIVAIPDSVTNIAAATFMSCTNLESVKISNSVTRICDSTFRNCISLKSVTIGNSVTSIGNYVFYGCKILESITIPDSVTSVGKDTFYNCTSLTDVYYSGSEIEWNNISIGSNNTYLTGATIHYNSCAHNYNLTSKVEPTCLECGYEIYTCSKCGEQITNEFAALGHDYNITDTVSPTCTEVGYDVYKCSRCGESYTANYVEPLGHSYDDGVVIKKATCTDTGIRKYTCTRCSSSYTETIEKTSHKTVFTTVTKPTCTEKGSGVYTCSVCGEKLGVETSIDALGHNYELSDFKNATCTEDGYNSYECSRCGDKKTDVVKSSGHSYSVSTVSPTCTEKGYDLYTCSVCAQQYKDNYKNALGHNTVRDAAVAATCTQTGKTEGSHCSKCGTVIKAQEIIPTTSHTYAEKIEKDPNCCWEGTMRYTCVSCGNSYTTVIPATGQHTFSEHVRVAATCTSDGVMDHICEFCQYAYSTVIPATGKHEYGSDGKCIYCNAYNTVAVVSVGGETYTLGSNNEYVSSTVKKPGISKLTKGKKQFKVTWKKVSGVTGYQVQYATDKKFKKNKKTVTVKGAKTTSKTVKGLKSKKTYYVRVRTYKTVKVNGKSTKVYSGWSKAKSVKTK